LFGDSSSTTESYTHSLSASFLFSFGADAGKGLARVDGKTSIFDATWKTLSFHARPVDMSTPLVTFPESNSISDDAERLLGTFRSRLSRQILTPCLSRQIAT
jgi:hypothetical protein